MQARAGKPGFSALILALVLVCSPASGQTSQIPLRAIADARNLPAPGSGETLRLQGIVTAFSGWKNSFFLQDSTGAISVDRTENTSVQPGDEVDVIGHLQAGLFANVFVSDKTSVTGHPGLPQGRASSYSELRTGDYDSKLVQVNGVVHSVHVTVMWGRPMVRFDLQMGNEAIAAYLPDVPNSDLQYLVDSEVRVSGACGTIFNDRRQLMGLRLFLPSIREMQVLIKAKPRSSIPLSRLDSLLTFHGPSLDHEVRFIGIVTYHGADGEVFLQNGRAAIRVASPAPGVFAAGDRAEAWGFVTTNQGYLPNLSDAFLKKLGAGPSPPIVRIRPSDVFKVENGFDQAPYDGLLVQLQAKVVDRLPTTGVMLWTLEADGVRFVAEVANAPSGWALGFESGAHVTVTGICVAESDQHKNLSSFHVLMRSPSDFEVVSKPYWNQSLLLILATYAAILIAGFLIYVVLKGSFLGKTLNENDGNSRVEAVCCQISNVLAAVALVVALSMLFLGSHHRGTGLLAGSFAILLSQRRNGKGIIGLLRLVCVAMVILKGGAALTEGLTAWKWLRFAEMPLSTALALSLVGCSSLAAKSRRLAGAAQMLAVAVALTALMKLLGALYGANAANGLAEHLLMSVPSAVALLSLSVAILLGTPDSGLMKTICSPRLGGMMLRRMIPAAVVLPIAIGWIRLQLQVMGLFDTRFGLTLFALANIMCFCFVLWISAAFLNRLDLMKSRAEETLREREHKLELIFDTGSMGDWTWNIEPDALFAHASVWRIYGESPKTGSEPAEWFRQRQHPDDRPYIEAQLLKAQTEKQPLDIEFRIVWPDSSIHWVYCRAVPIFDQHEKLVQMSGINLDVTDRKTAETKLKETEERFRQLQDAMPQIVWTADEDGRLIHYNRRWVEYTGLSLSGDWRAAMPKDSFESIAAKWANSVKLGVPYEDEVLLRRASDGSYRWHLARAVPVPDAQGRIAHWFGTSTDIDDFKRATEELRALNRTLEMRSRELAQSERKFRLIVDSVHDYAIYMLDEKGLVSSWNIGAESLMGYPAEEIIGRHFSAFFPPKSIADGEPERSLKAAATEGRVSLEAERIRKDGSRFWGNILINAVYDADGKLCGFSNICHDITERRRKQEQSAAAHKQAEEANQAKSSFLAAMSHEIRTPMNSILGMADLLWDTQLNPDQREYVRLFRRAGANLVALINDILDLSKIESGRFDLEMVHFDLLELVERVKELASPGAAAKGLLLETKLVPGTSRFLVGDPVRLQQILSNLIGNAIKFTESGLILLEIGPHPDGKIEHLEFSVSDTGIGIASDKLATIFEDFIQAESSTTRRFGGTGLGLGICRRLVEKMHGALTAESSPGKGSTFRFDAMFTISNAFSSGEVTRDQLSTMRLTGGPRRKLRILLADDSADNRFLVEAYLAGRGHELTSVDDGQKAIDALAHQAFDVILMDVQMPVMDGLTATRRIRTLEQERSQAPVAIIAVTGNAFVEDTRRSYEAGCTSHLTKPISKDKLLAALEGVDVRSLEITPPASYTEEPSPAYVIDIPPGFEEISSKYIRKHLAALPRMKTLLEDGGLNELRVVGHNLKGSGTSYGFADLTALGSAIEEAAEKSDMNQLRAQMARLDRYLQFAVDSVAP